MKKSGENLTNGRLEIVSREGSKVLSFTEHPKGDGSLQVTDLNAPLSARELRAAANQLEDCEKTLVMERVSVQEDVRRGE
ncbi:MAG: hypothetical protein DRP70_11925 [Spirochaetes bacterium]|nr:MAG: hypothetical protein DRP70_11925 [Spirochaetota bacterium]RKX96831.1 MAG: hypothetical protein DRZ90_08120 [Spirochaetota bacterium]